MVHAEEPESSNHISGLEIHREMEDNKDMEA